jgi:hypothetical protein
MKVLDAIDLRMLLPLGPQVIMADAAYACPTEAWLSGKFWDWFHGMRWNLGLNNWTRRNDCDNFARAYAQAAADAHALTELGNEVEGLAVGEFYYFRAVDHGAHAIVVAVTENGLRFIEPQNGQFIKLSEEEINSCFFARF